MPIYTPIETTILEVREDEKIESGISRYRQNKNMSEIKAKQSERRLLDQIPMLLISQEREKEKNNNCWKGESLLCSCFTIR